MVAGKSKIHYGWLVLAMGTIAVVGALGLARFGYSTVLPSMQADIGLNNEQAGLLATANLAGYLIMAIIGGALAARFGARLTASLGLLLAGMAMMLTGFAGGFLPVALWRGLTGIGSGAANVSIMGLWAAWFSSSRRGLASGICVSGSSIALIITGITVPGIISAGGQGSWRTCWLIFGVVTVILAIGAFLIIRNNPGEKGCEPVGARTGEQTLSVPKEKSGGWKNVYMSGRVWHLGLVYIAYGFSYIIYMTFFIKFLITECGYDTVSSGRMFMLMGWCSLFCGLAWGMLSDKIGRKRTLVIIYLIQASAYCLFAFGSSPAFFIPSVILFGFTAWSIPAVMAATCGDLLGPKMAPAAIGFITLFFGIGQALGPYAAGAIADAKGSFSLAFLLAAVIALIGAAASSLLKKDVKKKELVD